jgi:hypothetical protein
MILKDVLNQMGDKVWVRVRIHEGKGNTTPKDLVLWSADWRDWGEDAPGMPADLKDVLDCDVDDLSIEKCFSPVGRAPMIVVNVYPGAISRMYVLIRLDTSPNPMNCDFNIDKLDSKVFRTLEEARNAMRSEFDNNMSESDCYHSYEEDEAHVIDDEGNEKYWKIMARGINDEEV